MERTSIFEEIKSQYVENLDPTIIAVNILIEESVVSLEIIKDRDPYTTVVYKYDLKTWDEGPTYTAKESGLSNNDDFSFEAKEFAHLSLPMFDAANGLDICVAQFVDLFLLDKEKLMNLTDLFADNGDRN